MLYCNSVMTVDDSLHLRLKYISKIIKKKNIVDLKKVCTKEGLLTIIEWTDTFKNIKLTHGLAKSLENSKKLSILKYENKLVVKIGEKDPVLDASMGFLMLEMIDSIYYISEFRGAK